MKPLRVVRAAEREARAAAERYESEREGLGDEFTDELAKVFERMRRMPLSFPPHLVPGVRKGLLSRFPYTVYFEPFPLETLVYAVAHQSRRTDYWANRR